MDKFFVDDKFLEYSTLDKIRSLLELFNELKNQCTDKNKVSVFKRNVLVTKIIKNLEDTLKKIDLTDVKEDSLGECFEAINFNDYIVISTWLVELIEQDFYDQINSISLLKDYLKILYKYKD
jgi:hypothetical protein